MNNCCCKKKCCDNDPCGCPLRVLSICEISDQPGVLEFDLDGHPVQFDFSDLVARTQTDTHLRLDTAHRTLRYGAERHTNNVTASQLGSILHIADLGDVDITDVTNNSLLAYQKNSDCGQGCGTPANKWVAFNATEHYEDTATSVLGFDETGRPLAIQPPLHTDQYYFLNWRAGEKVGYEQPVEVASPSIDGSGYSFLLFVNPTTKQIESLKVRVSIDNSGNVTFNTH